MQFQSKIPLIKFPEIHFFAAEKVKACFANTFSLPRTHPQQSDTQAGIRDINWPDEVCLPKQMQCQPVQYQCYIYFVVSQVSQALTKLLRTDCFCK